MRAWMMLAALALFPAISQAAEPAAVRERLIGKWHVTDLNLGDMSIPAEKLEQVPWNWDITADKIVSHRSGAPGSIHDEVLIFAFGTDGKSVDFTNPGKETLKGIYTFDGDTFVICFNMDEKADRPTEIAPGKKLVKMTMKRSK